MIHDMSLFPTVVRVIEPALDWNLFRTLHQHINLQELQEHPYFLGGARSSHRYDDLPNDWLARIPEARDAILKHVQDIAVVWGYQRPINISNSFINVYHSGGWIRPHVHPNSIFSGVLYLDVDDQSSGITFVNPNPHVPMMYTTHDTFPRLEEFTVAVRNNMLVLFPSWLKHMTAPNSSQHRVVCAFNTYAVWGHR